MQIRTHSACRVRPAVAATLAALITVAAACGDGDRRSEAPPPTPRETTSTAVAAPEGVADDSRWTELLDGMGPEGEVSVELAVDAFSLAVAPLPGSRLRAEAGDALLHDATHAVAWVLRHFDELTPEQRAAVAAALSSPDAPPASPASGLRRAGGPQIGCYGQVVATADSPGAEAFRAEADAIVEEIEANLGGTIELVAPTYLVLDHRDAGLGLAYTWADPGDCEQNVGMATCTIHLSGRAEAMVGADRRMVLAHELFHCFQFQYLGVGAYEMPAWILEGLPAWIGEDMSGGTATSTTWWTPYLTNPGTSLYRRDYDAIGFYAHLDEVGIDPWTRVTAIFDGFSNEPAFEAAGASSGSFLESWPSSHLRRTDLGRAWDATGPGITLDRATPNRVEAGVGMTVLDVGKVSGALYDVSFSADVVSFTVTGTARLAAEGGIDIVLASGSTFCTREDACVCPGDSGGPDAEQLPPRATIAVTGGTVEGDVTVIGAPLDCERTERTDVDPCVVGTWVSTQSYIDDTVTNAPATELGGGAGIVLTIAGDGSFTMDFDASTPTATNVAGNVMGTQTRGVAHGRITAVAGTLTLLENDYADTLTTKFSTGGSIPGGNGIGTGSYSCSNGHLEARSPFQLGETINTFVAA